MASIKNCRFGWLLIKCRPNCRDFRCISTSSSLAVPTSDPRIAERTKCTRTKRRECMGTASRSFFNLPNMVEKKKEYAGRKLVGYSMEQMYSVVSDVKNYTKFVPFCKRSVILASRPGHLKADLVIGFPPIVESYTSSVTLASPHLVKAVCTEGKLFNHLVTLWRFSPGLRQVPQSCVIDFSVAFEFRSALHSHLAHVFFNEVVRQMEGAFLTEATRRYGKPAVRAQNLGLAQHTDT